MGSHHHLGLKILSDADGFSQSASSFVAGAFHMRKLALPKAHGSNWPTLDVPGVGEPGKKERQGAS